MDKTGQRDMKNPGSTNLEKLRAELEQTKAELEDCKAQIDFLTQQTLLPVMTLQDNQVVYANQAFADLMDITLDEVMGLKAEDIIRRVDPEFRTFAREQSKKKMAGQAQGIVEHYQYKAVDKKGNPGWIDHYSKTVRFRGRPASMACMINITKQKKTEKALTKANEIINNSPAVAFLWRNQPGWPVAFVSDNVERVFGYPANSFLEGRINYAQVIFPDDLERVTQEVTTYSARKNRHSFLHSPYRILTRWGDIRWVDDRTFIKRDPQGRAIQFQGVLQDITETKIAQDRLKESEDRCRRIIENAPDAFFAHDLEGRFCHVNHLSCLETGYTDQELLALNVRDLIDGEMPERVKQIWVRLKKGQTARGELTLRRKNGSAFPAELTATTFEGENHTQIFGFFRDITAQKKEASEKEALIEELQKALEEVKQLSGLLPICSRCKKIRDDRGYWNLLETYIEAHSHASFSHGLCPACQEDLYGDQPWYRKQQGIE